MNTRTVEMFIAPLAVAVSIAATASVRRLGVVPMPRADRWNRKPTALLGGVGMFVVTT